jgi:methyltransferase, FkbM family
MQYDNLLPRLCKIMNNFQDEESTIIYEARINYLFTRNEDEYYKVLGKLKKDSYCMELEDFLKDNVGCKGIVIYGAEEEGIRTKRLLDSCHRAAQFFCDDGDSIGKRIEGLRVISTDELLKKYKEYIVVLSKQSCMADAYSLLLRSGFPRKQILFPMHWHLVACNGRQYFDVLSPVQNEIFVDAGAYNGDTIRDFLSWSGKEYKRIYAFEPNTDMIPVIKEFLTDEQIENVIFTPQATWSEQAELNFYNDASASRVGKDGRTKVQATDIDSIVGDDKVTFIKMDVEGGELQSLIGARNTIRENKPRLAISVYHHPEDVVEIAEYILELNPEYKLLLRQYNSNFWETILYAF